MRRVPIEVLSKYTDISKIKDGERITVLNGHEICKKYIPRRQHRRGGYSDGNRTRKKKVNVSPLFKEHADTEQLAYNLSAFRAGDEIEITLKMHGTSQRTAYLPVFKGYKRTILDKILKREGTPIYDWGYVSGTRRTVLENYEGGYYGSNEFREQHSKIFENRLWKGEEIFYEVVGFTHTGTPIMGECDNRKTKDKEFIKQYGNTTTFSYGCSPTGWDREDIRANPCPVSDIYVYRMTMTNEDGNVVEYTPDFMRYRCEQIGVKCCPLLAKVYIRGEGIFVVDHEGEEYGIPYETDIGEMVRFVSEKYYDGTDPIGKTHIREGVVVRIVNRPKFAAYKHKNFNFKVLEGIVKADAEAPDIEEAEELTNE